MVKKTENTSDPLSHFILATTYEVGTVMYYPQLEDKEIKAKKRLNNIIRIKHLINEDLGVKSISAD